MPMTRYEAVSAHNELGELITALDSNLYALKATKAWVERSGYANGDLDNAVQCIESEMKHLSDLLNALPEPDECPDTLTRKQAVSAGFDLGDFARDTLIRMNNWHAEAAE